ncbi:MAG: beta-propeller domain-containing protein [Firmicutes bacterium]|nr:beta-propeller domain-containing protein [Bacillota bacterium]
MKRYKETFEKIQADEELKTRIVQRASEDTYAPVKPVRAKGARQSGSKWVLSWQRLTAAAMAAVMVLTLTATLLFLPLFSGGRGPGEQPVIEEPWDGESANALPPVSTQRDEIFALLKSKDTSGGGGDGYYDGEQNESDTECEDGRPEYDAPSDPNTGAKKPDNDYATTNVQHEGVDEGDIIKVDNNFIYTLSRAGLLIVSVKDKLQVTYEAEYTNFYPDEMFIFGDQLIVIGGQYSQISYDYYGGSRPDVGMDIVPYWAYRTHTMVVIYALGDRSSVTVQKQYSITGNFVTSRLISNKLIVAVSHSVYYYNEDSYFPHINGEELSTDNIYLYETENYSYYAILASINLNNLNMDVAAHLGLVSGWNWANVVYFSADNMYFFSQLYEYTYGDESYFYDPYYSYGFYYYNYSYSYRTAIVKINLNSLKYVASQKIDGHVYDRYWADEYKNNLRVVSWFYSYGYKDGAWRNERYTCVHVLDNNLEVIGSIRDIAENENIYSVRFNKDEASFVTFFTVDPLFKVDLSDPKNPTVNRGLKEDGVNDYLQYLSDDVILGLGRNLPAAGMKIALYDNTGEDAVNINTQYIGNGYAYSEALNNPKAILNDTGRNMFSFAVTMKGSGAYRQEMQGLLVFEYNLNAASDKDKLICRGILSNFDEQTQMYEDWDDYYYNTFSYIKRGARIGNKIYTISDRFIASYDVGTLELIERLDIYNDPCHFTCKWKQESHTYPTCTEAGEVVYRCKINPTHEYSYTYGPYGHSWMWFPIVGNDEWIMSMPTADKDGCWGRICSRCNYEEVHKLVYVADGLILKLNLEGTEYSVMAYVGTTGRAEIPASHDGIPVVAIEHQAFMYNTSIINVTVPKSVVSIGNYSFRGCPNLQDVTFEKGSGLEYLGYYAFSNCANLVSVTFDKDSPIKYINSNAFSNCVSLENIAIPNNVTSIGSYAFWGCTKLRSVNIPKGTTNIGYNTFIGCVSLENLTVDKGNKVYKSEGDCIIHIATKTLVLGSKNSIIPDYVTTIGAFAFRWLGITEIVIPKSVVIIGDSAFHGCKSLRTVTFEKDSGLRFISPRAFAYSAIEEITIPKGVEIIGSSAFDNCMSLTSVTFEGDVKVIESYAFRYCMGIASIDIPASVVRVDYYAFGDWTNGQTINIYGIASQYDADMRWGIYWRYGCGAVVNYLG